jgi:hypothetical protein
MGRNQKLINIKKHKMKPLKSDIRKHSTKMVETMVENISNYLHFEYATTSGDLSPHQQWTLNDTKETLSNLIVEQVFQNLDFTKFDIHSLTREELMELAYSLDWNGSWDSDEEGQEPITKDELIEAILDLITINE